MNNLPKKIRIGTRTSKLALSQVAEVHLLLAQYHENLSVEIVPISTSGDKIQDRNLSEIGGKGLFIKELEEALINKRIDIAIHSAKDVPPIIDDSTEICAFSERLDVRDCMVSKKFSTINSLPKGAKVGTSSARRKAFLLRQRPDLEVINFRGNVDTRLQKVFEGEVDAAILATSGLLRIGKERFIQSAIEISEMLPSGGQGSLAIQALKDNKEICEIAKKINDYKTYICVKTERSFLRELGASCFTPVGVNAFIEDEKLILKTAIIDYSGQEIYETNSFCEVKVESGIELGILSARKTKDSASELLKKICSV